MLPYINTPIEPLAKATGGSVDELKLLLSFLISYPLAAVLKRLPDEKPWQKNAFIIGASLFYLVGLFDLWDGVRTILYSAVGTYAIAYYIDGSLMPWIGFVFLMGHMSINHLERQFTNTPAVVDITGAQMVMVMKLSGFCWNIHDGRLKQETLTDSQRDRAIKTMPSFLDYAAYVLFFPSLMAGPAFEFNDYKRWLELSMFDVHADEGYEKASQARSKRRIPRSGRPASWKAIYGVIWVFLFIKFSSWYTVPFALSDGFIRYSFLRRVWYIYMLAFTARLKYYGVWALTEGACILSGLGYNGIDPATKRARWNRLENVNPWNMETAQNSRAYLDNWNKNTNVWLRNYIYLRVTPKGQKPGFRASLATFATSAFWHGFYPGYYLTFPLGAFIQTVAKNFRRHVRPFFLSPRDGTTPTSSKIYYDIFSWLVTQLAFSFAVTPFVVLRFTDSITIWARLWFYCVIGVAGTMAIFASPVKPFLIQKLKTREAERMPGLEKSTSQLSSASGHQPMLGLPGDLGGDIGQAILEIKVEVEARKRRGSKVTMPTGADLKNALEQKLGRKLK